MRYIAICDDPFFYYLLRDLRDLEGKILFLVQETGLARWLTKKGATVLKGDLSGWKIYHKAQVGFTDKIVLGLRDLKRLRSVVRCLLKHRRKPSLVLTTDKDSVEVPSPEVKILSYSDLLAGSLVREVKTVSLREKIRKLQRFLERADRILLLVQDDPDPDAIASALAFRALLGRNKLTAPIGSFGVVERPENIAMLKELEIDVERVHRKSLSRYDRICFFDTQPNRFPVIFPRIDVVIDHHPADKGYRAAYRDIRPNQGATSAILTEYLRAADVKISQRLATALIYGIESDTFFLERGTSAADVEAFSFLYPLANHALIRRIERPEFSQREARFFDRAIRGWRIDHRILVSHLGSVPRQDIVPRLADFCTQVEGIDWSIISGLVDGDLVISGRNLGESQSAGSLFKEAFGRFGRAGGHRFMAKGVIPRENLKKIFGKVDHGVRDKIFNLFREAMQREELAG